jgi:hypothetical protein
MSNNQKLLISIEVLLILSLELGYKQVSVVSRRHLVVLPIVHKLIHLNLLTQQVLVLALSPVEYN